MSLTDDILMHYGMPRRSGRYPWGSGDNPYQHSGDFLSRVEEMKKSNFTFTDADGKTYTGEVAIAKSMGLSTTQFRTQMRLAKDERRSADVATAKALREKGYSLNEIMFLTMAAKLLISLFILRAWIQVDFKFAMQKKVASIKMVLSKFVVA